MINLTSSIQYQATLEVLKRKQADQFEQLKRSKENLSKLCTQMQEEKADVDRLETDGFTTSLLKLLRLHDGKLTKESEEYLKAKLNFERQEFEVEEAERQLGLLASRIKEVETEAASYQETLSYRTKALEALPNGDPQRAVYENFANKERALKSESVEIEEAIEACKRAIETKNIAMNLLESAESWATWDAWAGGGLITDMVKYEKIEAVQVQFKKLSADINQLKREMSDLGENVSLKLADIDSTTQLFDVWFDNIFTDLKVKAQIYAQIEALQFLATQLNTLNDSLSERYQVTMGGLKACTEALEGLLMD